MSQTKTPPDRPISGASRDWPAPQHGEPLARARLSFCNLLLGVIGCILAVIGGPAMAGEAGTPSEDGFSALELEALMNVEVIPVNVLGTHTHFKDEWMAGYRFMHMAMNGNRDGTASLSNSDVLAAFPVTPLRMSMQMHMAMLMYAPSDDLTLMAMLPYLQLEMDHLTRMGVRFTTRSEGFGDVRLGARYTAYRNKIDEHRLILGGEVSLPSGSIDKRDFMADPSMGRQKLAYPMQLGSGTTDLLPGITYIGQSQDWAWGAEANATLRLGRNENGYTLGDRYRLSAWGHWRWTNWVAPFARLDAEFWGNIDGADPDLNPAMVPTANPKLRGGRRVDLLLGINFYAPDGPLKGQRFAIQGGQPIYQSLDGPQLETDWVFSAGWQWVF